MAVPGIEEEREVAEVEVVLGVDEEARLRVNLSTNLQEREGVTRPLLVDVNKALLDYNLVATDSIGEDLLANVSGDSQEADTRIIQWLFTKICNLGLT